MSLCLFPLFFFLSFSSFFPYLFSSFFPSFFPSVFTSFLLFTPFPSFFPSLLIPFSLLFPYFLIVLAKLPETPIIILLTAYRFFLYFILRLVSWIVEKLLQQALIFTATLETLTISQKLLWLVQCILSTTVISKRFIILLNPSYRVYFYTDGKFVTNIYWQNGNLNSLQTYNLKQNNASCIYVVEY